MSDLHDRDPATGAGFTLIELVVVLAVVISGQAPAFGKKLVDWRKL